MKKLICWSVFFLILATPVLAGPLELLDDSGRTVTLAGPARRIVSLYGAHTENLFSLGLDQEIIGVSEHEDYPPAASNRPRFSHRDDPEKFLAARPDLVLVRPMIVNGFGDLIARLTQAGVPVVSLQPNTSDEMFAYWRTLGRLTGRDKEADAMVVGFQARLAELVARTAGLSPEKRRRVYFDAVHSKMKTFAPGAMPMFVLTAAGGINVAADAESVRGTNIAAYGLERLLARAAEIDVFLAQTGPMNRVTIQEIAATPGFQAIKAVREGNICLVDENLVSRPTMRLLEGIQTVGHVLYPDIFPSSK